MAVRFLANDGQEYTISDFTVLNELITKGVITGTTLLYEEDSKTWIAACEHPAARDRFAAKAPDETGTPKTHEPLPKDTRAVHRPKKRKLNVWLIRAAGISLSAIVLFELYSVRVNGKVAADPIRQALPLGACFVLCVLLAVLAYVIGKAIFGDVRRSFLPGYSLLYAFALACSFYLIPSPRTQSTIQTKGSSIETNSRSSSDKKPKPPASDLLTASPMSPENLAAAQVEQMVHDRLQLEVYRLILRLNQANPQDVVFHPSKLGTSWGLEESRRRIAESKLAANEFELGIKRIKEELVETISNKNIDPTYKRNYLESINQGSWHGMAVPQCQELVAALNGFLTTAENLAAFMTKAAYANDNGQVIFHDPTDQRSYDDYSSRARNAFAQVSDGLARLHDSGSPLLPTRLELVGTPQAKPGEQAAPGGGVEVQKSNGELEAKSPAPKEPLKPLLGPGQVQNLDCEQGKDSLIAVSEEGDGTSEALISSQEIIKTVLANSSNGAFVNADRTAPIIPPELQLSNNSSKYYSMVTFNDMGYYFWANKKRLYRVPCQPSGIGVLCIRGRVSVRIIE